MVLKKIAPKIILTTQYERQLHAGLEGTIDYRKGIVDSLSVDSLTVKPQEIEYKSEAEIKEAEFNAHAREVSII